MIKFVTLFLFLLSASVGANDNIGKIFSGKNLAKPAIEHTYRLYLKVNDSEKLYFNKSHSGSVSANLDLPYRWCAGQNRREVVNGSFTR